MNKFTQTASPLHKDAQMMAAFNTNTIATQTSGARFLTGTDTKATQTLRISEGCDVSRLSLKDVMLPSFIEDNILNLNNMRKNCVFTDVVLVCAGVKFEAHRSYLFAASEYFSQLLKTVSDKNDYPTLEINDTDPHSLEIILNIIYTGKLKEADFGELKNLLSATHTMQLQDIFNCYRKQFIARINTENYMVAWKLGQQLEDEIILQAVYKIAEDIYMRSEFLTVDMTAIRKLLHYLSAKSCYDLILKIIIQWTGGCKENQLGVFEDFIKFVDLQKVSHSLLATMPQEPMLEESEIFKSKCLQLLVSKSELTTSVEESSTFLPSFYLYGHDEGNCWILQKCNLGEWNADIHLQDVKSENSTIIADKFQLYIIEKTHEHKAVFSQFDKKGERQRYISLGYIPPEAKLTGVQSGNLFTVIAHTEQCEDDFFCSVKEKIFEKHYIFGDEKILRLQIVSCDKHLYQIKEMEKDGEIKLYILQFMNYNYEWTRVYETVWKDSYSNWFSYFYAPKYLIVRVFPGISLWYNIEDKTVRTLEKGKKLNDVVSLDISGCKLWCLTRGGLVYIQDIHDTKSDWKLVTKSPFTLKNYTQIAVGNI